MKSVWAFGILSFALSGCAGTVQTTRLDHRYESDIAVQGVSYALPMLQYDITVTHTLTGCGGPGDVARNIEAMSLGFDTKVERAARYVPGEQFNVDYRKLSGLFRTSSFSIEYYPSGAIKSIGAAAEDKTGDAIKSAAKLAGGVMALTTGGPGAVEAIGSAATQSDVAGVFATTDQAKQKIYDCADDARALLARLETAKADLKSARSVLADASNAVERLGSRFALKVTQEGDAAAWDKAIDDQFVAKRDLGQKQEALDKAKEPLSASYTIQWPTQRLVNSEDLPLSNQVVALEKLSELLASTGFARPALGEVIIADACHDGANASKQACLAAHLDLYLHFVSDPPQPPVWDGTRIEAERTRRREQPLITDAAQIDVVDTSNKTLEGLLYREPSYGGVVICLKKDASRSSCGVDPLVKPEMVNFPQRGQLRFIPLQVLPFQGKDQTIEFTEDGYPSKITIKSTKAAAAEALGAGADAATTLVEAVEKRRSDIAAAQDAAVAELTGEIALLEKQAKIDELRAPAKQPSSASLQLAELQADIEMKRATLLQLLLAKGIETGAVDPTILFGS